jgi:hypothetical protein
VSTFRPTANSRFADTLVGRFSVSPSPRVSVLMPVYDAEPYLPPVNAQHSKSNLPRFRAHYHRIAFAAKLLPGRMTPLPSERTKNNPHSYSCSGITYEPCCHESQGKNARTQDLARFVTGLLAKVLLWWIVMPWAFSKLVVTRSTLCSIMMLLADNYNSLAKSCLHHFES